MWRKKCISSCSIRKCFHKQYFVKYKYFKSLPLESKKMKRSIFLMYNNWHHNEVKFIYENDPIWTEWF